jgi:saccharopine dehydrogenase-like NADP-dependent oxidoreductase
MKGLNMLDDSVKDFKGMSYADFLAETTGSEVKNLKVNLAKKLRVSLTSAAIQSLDFLGFFSDEKLHYHETTPFEITSDRMIKKMSLTATDRDMVVLQHIFLASYPDGNREVIKSSMIDFGSPLTNTSISRTVVLPAAIAVRMILEKKISATGVIRPVIPQIYNPVLDQLKTLGMEMKEEYGLPESEMIP